MAKGRSLGLMPLFSRKPKDSESRPPAKVDAVAIGPDGTADLILGFGTAQSLESLRERLQAYVSFALDGQMVQLFPETDGRPIRIIVAPDGEPRANVSWAVAASFIAAAATMRLDQSAWLSSFVGRLRVRSCPDR